MKTLIFYGFTLTSNIFSRKMTNKKRQIHTKQMLSIKNWKMILNTVIPGFSTVNASYGTKLVFPKWENILLRRSDFRAIFYWYKFTGFFIYTKFAITWADKFDINLNLGLKLSSKGFLVSFSLNFLSVFVQHYHIVYFNYTLFLGSPPPK